MKIYTKQKGIAEVRKNNIKTDIAQFRTAICNDEITKSKINNDEIGEMHKNRR